MYNPQEFKKVRLQQFVFYFAHLHVMEDQNNSETLERKQAFKSQ
jgi:hypothetical protein